MNEAGLAMIARWIAYLTLAHLEEKIRESRATNREYAVLLDEMMSPGASQCVAFSALYNHVEALLVPNSGTMVTYIVEDEKRMVVTLYWGNGYAKEEKGGSLSWLVWW